VSGRGGKGWRLAARTNDGGGCERCAERQIGRGRWGAFQPKAVVRRLLLFVGIRPFGGNTGGLAVICPHHLGHRSEIQSNTDYKCTTSGNPSNFPQLPRWSPGFPSPIEQITQAQTRSSNRQHRPRIAVAQNCGAQIFGGTVCGATDLGACALGKAVDWPRDRRRKGRAAAEPSAWAGGASCFALVRWVSALVRNDPVGH